MHNSSKLNVVNVDFTVNITDQAAKQVRGVINDARMPETAGLRVRVVEGGCSGLNYDVKIVEGPDSGDTTIEINKTRVFVNEFSAQHVNGMIVDWISSMQESRFVFQNPNETGSCGCGTSFSV